MKPLSRYFAALLLFFLTVAELQAQFGNPNSRFNNRRRSAIPQVQETPKEPEPMTAEQIVDGQMPVISETLELNEFETAVLSSILKKHLQKRIEMQILELPADQMREGLEKIAKEQDAELQAGLPPDKYEAFKELQKDGLQKTKKKQKKERKKKKKNKD
ncbi:MAG: hypothetical protein AAFX53_11065 [Bacteroidota bacterium]